MDAHATHTPSCPVCRRNAGQLAARSPHQLIGGLLTCQHCRERLVVTWSGHYVRDPFVTNAYLPKSYAVGSYGDVARSLRRDSHPLARFCRDLGLRNPQSVVTFASSVLVLGTACWLLQNACSKPLPMGHPPQTALEMTP